MLEKLFRNKELLKQALTLSHHGKSAPYERLEFLGDRVLGLIIADMLYHTFDKEKEGELARRFTGLVREETLAQIAVQLNLGEMMITKEHELRANRSVLSDVCEAVLGALYLDSGLEAVRSFMEPIWTPLLHMDKKAPKDAKSALQEWAQQHGHKLPVYTLIDKTGEEHAPRFIMQVDVDGLGQAIGEGTNKKTAEQTAASNLLKQVK
ncbi:MAG: ribonuclease III [Alphaproteobacteria bacterium]|nr:ribonuclease III [Alphaproteobacteria bacterium]